MPREMSEVDILFIRLSAESPDPLPLLTEAQLGELVQMLKLGGIDVNGLDYQANLGTQITQLLIVKGVNKFISDYGVSEQKASEVLPFAAYILWLACYPIKYPGDIENITSLINSRLESLLEEGLIHVTWPIYCFLTGRTD